MRTGLHPQNPRRERILVMGPPGAGKSTTWKDIAEWYDRTGAQGTMYVADSDGAWEGQRPTDGHLDGRVKATDVYDFPSIVGVVEEATTNFQSGDFLVIDMIDKAWSYAQSHYYEQVYGKELDQFWLEAKKDGVNPGGEWGSNWTVINKLHQSLMLKLQRYPGHLIACAPVAEVRQPDRQGAGGDRKEILHLFGKFGVKPQGQKDLPYNFHTVLFLQDVPRLGYTYTSIKDRDRELVSGEPLASFVKSYLIAKAGWLP